MADIFDNVTRRYISIDLAYQRGFPSNRFRIPANSFIFAYPDKRKKTGLKFVLLTNKTDIANAKKTAKAQQVYPPAPLESLSLSLAPVKATKNWEYQPFTLPLELATQARAGEKNRQIAEIQFMSGNTIIHSDEIDFRQFTSLNDWWESPTNLGFLRYDDSAKIRPAYADYVRNSDSLRIIFYKNINPQRIAQRYNQQVFLDSVDSHCIFDEIIKYFEELVAEAKSPKTKSNRNSLLNKAKAYRITYKKGIPEEEVEAVAKSLDICIVMEDPLFFTIKSYNVKARNKKFRYIFSRLNHGEYITVSLSDEPIPVSQEEARNILQETFEQKKWNKYMGTITDPTIVYTATNIYRVETPQQKMIYEFNKLFDWGMRIDSVKEPELAKFLKAGAKVMINWKNSTKTPTDEIDMKKAYTQYKHAPHYNGFPAIITNVANTDPNHDVIKYPGIYEITITKMPNAPKLEEANRAIKLLRSYGFKEGTYILTSPWITLLKKYNIKLTINKGAWGKRFDFDFTTEMIESKAYQIWTGMQIHLADECMYKMYCNRAYADTIKATSEHGHLMYYNDDTNTLIMRQPKEHHYIMPHIGAFIVGYCQLNIFKESLKYDPKDIVGTKLDSILLATEPKDISPLFVNLKEDPEWDGRIRMSEITIPHIYEEAKADLPYNPIPFVLGDAFISGMGGGGKTYNILSTPSLRKPLYVTRAWKLIAEKMQEFPHIHGCSINQLLGFDFKHEETQSIKDRYGQPPVIVCDEMSMWSLDEVTKLFTMYPYSQILLAGDYAKGHYYQSSVTTSEKLYHPENAIMTGDTTIPPLPIIHLDKDLRSKDELTRAFKKVIREFVDSNDFMALRSFLLSRFTVEKLKDIKYDMDYILTGTNERMRYFTKELMNEDKNKNHYLVLRHNMTDVFTKLAGKEAFLHGELVQHDQAEGRTEPRHAFTVHSFQGITIKEPKKCYIDIMHLSLTQDIYTAISRVQSIDQIHLIN